MLGSQPKPGFTGLLRNFFNLGTLLFKFKGVISITAILLVLSCIHSISESINQKTPMPFFRDVGGKLINYDNNLYDDSSKIVEAGGLVIENSGEGFIERMVYYYNFLKVIGNMLVNVWYLYFFFFLIYKIFSLNNTSNVATNIVIAAVFVIMLQIMSNFIIIEDDIDYQKDFSISEKFIPFKGVGMFIKSIPLITNPIYEHIDNTSQNNQLMNQSL